ncbi:manganese-dependent inorganic pyrophosphatase [Ferrimonas sp. YFM]|uniref:manganese-dependent inorganic pyrophosphatase n=1 Tax=Ferrimonas sp. YFM TaxID=3028878 RepID=UPI002573E283|nr:manganese-dependent inorganic pyrophosphatase [Ferrimonas sp. YFM]BDY04307.1 manganese-dependent inorganic pyrophosphatase [Ferrimonas sp. YFM]
MNTLLKTALALSLATALSVTAADLDIRDGRQPLSADTLWMGHITPDTDTVVSAIAAAEIYGGQARVTGDLNKETRYVLDSLFMATPPLAQDLSSAKVALVDFNQTTQLMQGVQLDNIEAIIDHHALRDNPITFSRPVAVNIKPWGSAASIIADDALTHGLTLSKTTAGLLLAGVLSDTLNLSSVTTTDHDRRLVAQLASIAELHPDDFAQAMFQAKSDLSDKSAYEIVVGDYKNYSINGKAVGFGVAEVLDSGQLLQRTNELKQALTKAKQTQKREHIFFAIVDMQQKTAYVLTSDNTDAKLAEKAYGKAANSEGITVLSDTLSRKRQMMPAIKRAL